MERKLYDIMQHFIDSGQLTPEQIKALTAQ
jgi:hypothetical protein